MNLVSVSQLCESSYFVSFSSTSCEVQDLQSQRLIGTGCKQGGPYVLDELRGPDVAASGLEQLLMVHPMIFLMVLLP